jgi:hypothetical protein
MKFRHAVESTAAIRYGFRKGLGAVRNVDHARLRCSINSRRLRGSVDLDEALRLAFPNDPRWDYAIGISQHPLSDQVVWLEVHPASSHHVDEVLNKLRWLRGWLANEAPALRMMPAHFCWVATGTVSFRRGSQEEKRIAQEGIRFPGKRLNLDEF